MSSERLEAFSDGVLAVIITIMVLELEVPHEIGIDALRPLLPNFLTYILSFIYVGIYWNNHHHMFQVTEKVTGGILWANLHLLFWLSLIPFVTGWMGTSNFAPLPAALYGGVLVMAAIAWTILQRAILANHEQDSLIAAATEGSYKEVISTILYIVAIIFAFIQTWVSGALYAVVALIWLIPDRRVERAIAARDDR